MSQLHEPRSVNARDIPDWLREAAKLFARRGLFFVVISLIYHFLAYSAETFKVFSFLAAVLLCQVAVCVCIVSARAADHCQSLTFGAIHSMVRNILWPLLLMTVLYGAIYLAGAALVLALRLDLPGGDHTGAAAFSILSWLSLGNASFLIVYMGITVSTLWFLTPIMTLNELTLRESVLLAKRAESRNQWVVFLVSYVPCIALAVVSLLSEWMLALGVFLVPLFGIFQYVAYRHVFQGKKANSPVPVTALEAAPIAR